MAAYRLGELEAISITTGEVIDLTPGAILGTKEGLFVYTDLPAVALDLVDCKPIALHVEYEPAHVLASDSSTTGCLVSEVVIKGVMFHDPSDRAALDHVFDNAEGRRKLSRGEPLTANEFPKRYAVMHAMRKELNHLLPMDAAYICTETTLRSMAKRVIKAHLTDNATSLYSKAERMLLQLLQQAVRVAKAYGAAQHVTHGVVDNKFIYRNSSVPDELHYDATKPLRMFSLIDVDAQGLPTLAPKA
jgi:hypothetical protein